MYLFQVKTVRVTICMSYVTFREKELFL